MKRNLSLLSSNPLSLFCSYRRQKNRENKIRTDVLATFIVSFLYSLVGIVALGMGAYGSQGRAVLFFVTLIVIVMIVITLLRWIQHLSQFGRMAETSQRVEDATAAALSSWLQDPCLGCSPWHGQGVKYRLCRPYCLTKWAIFSISICKNCPNSRTGTN